MAEALCIFSSHNKPQQIKWNIAKKTEKKTDQYTISYSPKGWSFVYIQ